MLSDTPTPQEPVKPKRYANDKTITSTPVNNKKTWQNIQSYLDEHKQISHSQSRQNNMHSLHTRLIEIQRITCTTINNTALLMNINPKY